MDAPMLIAHNEERCAGVTKWHPTMGRFERIDGLLDALDVPFVGAAVALPGHGCADGDSGDKDGSHFGLVLFF